MVISSFQWDDDNIFHIEKHQFTPEEVEEVFVGDHQVRRTRQKRYIALGETLGGRLAFVVFRRLPGGVVRVITARDMEISERRLFRRK
ncbi:MAG: BrnT family toxin [Acidobacteriia bacterium]|nr:BrnT family toxin [Terriglobia bacterium]